MEAEDVTGGNRCLVGHAVKPLADFHPMGERLAVLGDEVSERELFTDGADARRFGDA